MLTGEGGWLKRGTKHERENKKNSSNNLAWKLDVRKRDGRSERQTVTKINLKE
jgi:hypothetical protein